jgi:hypothetical protein
MDKKFASKLKLKQSLKKKYSNRGLSKTANLSPSKGDDFSKKANQDSRNEKLT